MSENVVVLQSARSHEWDVERIAQLVGSFGSVPVALLPRGKSTGEHELLRDATEVSGIAFLGLLPVDEVTAVLSAAGIVVTTRLQAAFVASALDRQVIVPNVEKTATALLACPEPPRILSNNDEENARAVAQLRMIDSLLPSGENAAPVFDAFHRTPRAGSLLI